MLLYHIAIIVSREECLGFYRDLGFEETSRQVRPSYHDTLVWMAGNGIVLEVFVDATHPSHVTNPEAYGLRHIALETNDLEGMWHRLGRYNPEPIRQDYGIFFVKDLDGCPIEIRERQFRSGFLHPKEGGGF